MNLKNPTAKPQAAAVAPAPAPSIALEANERAVIGAILADPAKVMPMAVKAGVTANSFTTALAQTAWAAMAKCGAENAYALALTCGEGVEDEVEFWMNELAVCLKDCLTTAHAAYYVGLLRKAEAARKARACFVDAVAALDRDPSGVWEVWKGVALDMREAKAIREAVER